MRISKTIQRILLIIVVVTLFVGGTLLFRYCFTGATVSDSFKYHIKQLQEEGDNVDMVFIGGSRTYRSFNPSIFDKALGIKNTTNCGSPSQRPILSYYVTKDMLEKFSPKYAVIGVSYNGLMFEQSPHTMYMAINRISPMNRIKCLYDNYGFSKGLMVLSGKSEFDSVMEGPGELRKNIKEKKSKRAGEDDEKEGRGYVGSKTRNTPGGVTYSFNAEERCFNESEMQLKSFEYLKKTIELCQSQGIKVYLVSGPCTMMNIYKVENYQGAVDFYHELANDYGIKYFNLNYMKGRENILTDDMFMDHMHVNYWGGQITSKFFAQVLKDDLTGKDTSHYFYRNLKDLKRDVHRIPGCTMQLVKEGDMVKIQVKCFHNEGVTPEYRLLATSGEDPNTAQFQEIHAWSVGQEYSYSIEELQKYTNVKLEAKTGEDGETVAFVVKSLERVIDEEQ